MTFNYDRIKNFHDRRLLALNVNYFKAFVDAEAAAMRALQREDFYITDIRKSLPLPAPVLDLRIYSSRPRQENPRSMVRNQRRLHITHLRHSLHSHKSRGLQHQTRKLLRHHPRKSHSIQEDGDGVVSWLILGREGTNVTWICRT